MGSKRKTCVFSTNLAQQPVAVLAPILWLLAVSQVLFAEVAESRKDSLALHIVVDNEPITPVTARFFKRALQEAEENQAECLVIELNTPGGLLEPTQQIVAGILASHVPVIVYVAPPGARAASAGLFITLASHVAAMAPGTRLGAAHPVQIVDLPFGPSRPPASEHGSQPE